MTPPIERRQIAPSKENPITLEQRAEGEDLPRIVGYSAVFGVDTEINTWFGSFRERLQKGAFRRAIREGQDVRALRNHDPDNLLGRTTAKTLRLKEDDTGLWIEVDPPGTSTGKDTVESIRRGDLSGMSFAFIVRKEKWINGEDGNPDVRIIQDVDLFDVGPVTFPAYASTSADLRSSSAAYQVGLAELGRPVPRLVDPEKDTREGDPGGENQAKPPVAQEESEVVEVLLEAEQISEVVAEIPSEESPAEIAPEVEVEQKSISVLRNQLRKTRAEKQNNEFQMQGLKSVS